MTRTLESSPVRDETPAAAAAVGDGRVAWRDVVLVALVALAVRLAYFVVNMRTNPAFDYLIMDSMHIDQWAKAIAAGTAGPEVYFRGPLVPYLLAFVYKVSHGSIPAAILVNHLSGAVTCVLVYALAREFFSRPVAVVSGLTAALYWPLIYFEGEVLVEPVFTMLVVLALWRLARAARVPTLARLAVAGVCLGAAALARPTILALVPALPFAFGARLRRRPGDPSPRRPWVRPTVAVLVACTAILTPVLVRNAVVGGAVVPVSWSGGLNFYIGNNDASDGRSAYIPGAHSAWMGGGDEALAIAAEQAGRPLSPGEASRYYFRRGLSYIAHQPVAAAGLWLKKLYMFWEGPERSNEKYIYFFWDRYGLGRVPMPGFWLISPLALTGLVLLWRQRQRLSLLYGFVVTYMIGVVAFFVVARFRLPAVPVLIIFAAWAAVYVVDEVRGRRLGGFLRALGLFAALLVVVNLGYPTFWSERNTHIAISHYTLAGALADRGDNDGALVELARARIAYERSPSRHYQGIAQDIYYKLGAVLYAKGRCKEAMDALGRMEPGDPRTMQARMMYADCCEKLGRPREAGGMYSLVLRTEPNNRRALEGLIRCYEATGHPDEAAEARKRLQDLGEPPSN